MYRSANRFSNRGSFVRWGMGNADHYERPEEVEARHVHRLFHRLLYKHGDHCAHCLQWIELNLHPLPF